MSRTSGTGSGSAGSFQYSGQVRIYFACLGSTTGTLRMSDGQGFAAIPCGGQTAGAIYAVGGSTTIRIEVGGSAHWAAEVVSY